MALLKSMDPNGNHGRNDISRNDRADSL